jgi:hypothetical protein
MKALAWHRFLESQLRGQNKKLFSVTELGNVSGSSLHALNVELSRLNSQGIITRYAQGKYGLPGVVNPVDLVTELDSGAYITGLHALYYHNLVTQVPFEITCFTNRRHNRSRVRETPVGRFIFICVSKRIYSQPKGDPIASKEKALCDYILLARRQGIAPESQVTFRQMNTLDFSRQNSILDHYPKSVAAKAQEIQEGIK